MRDEETVEELDIAFEISELLILIRFQLAFNCCEFSLDEGSALIHRLFFIRRLNLSDSRFNLS